MTTRGTRSRSAARSRRPTRRRWKPLGCSGTSLCSAWQIGAADGVNSHGLIRDLAKERAGRRLIYALVDLPTNAWGIAADHLRQAFGGSGRRA